MCAPRPRARGTQGDRELRAILSQPPGLCVFHFLTLLLHECAIPSFFLTLMIKSLLLPTRKREMQGSFQCHSTPQDWAFQAIYYCTASLWQRVIPFPHCFFSLSFSFISLHLWPFFSSSLPNPLWQFSPLLPTSQWEIITKWPDH